MLTGELQNMQHTLDMDLHSPAGHTCIAYLKDICNNNADMLSICDYYKYFNFGINSGHQIAVTIHLVC